MNQLPPKTRFLWLDVETTGLDPEKDLLLEVAAWPTRSADPFDLVSDDERSWVIGYSGEAVGRALSAVTWRMHSANGLLAEVAEAHAKPVPVDLPCAQGQMLEALAAAGEGVTWHLAGNSVHFDLGFLRAKMPRFAAKLSHRILDVSSVGILAKAMGQERAKGPAPHRAMEDVRASVKQLAEHAAWFRGPK